VCGGEGCQECNGEGRYRLTTCPKRELPEWMGDFLRAAKWMEKGLPPVAGGSQDQANWFLDACGYLEKVKARIEIELSEQRGK